MLVLLRGLLGGTPRVRRSMRQTFEDVAITEGRPNVFVDHSGLNQLNVDVNGRTTRVTSVESVYISPLLGDLSLSQFAGSFGNGITGGPYPLTINGVKREVILVRCIFPGILSDQQISRLREIYEGIPPGNPELNVWQQFDETGILPGWTTASDRQRIVELRQLAGYDITSGILAQVGRRFSFGVAGTSLLPPPLPLTRREILTGKLRAGSALTTAETAEALLLALG